MTEKFCLKWNDFHSNVSKSFSIFRDEDYLHDVTLVSDDQRKISAHKLVLSTCSEYFRDIFKANPHAHPLLCLDLISSVDLRNILDYIYNGEVQIHQENLDRFLSVAQRFKLKGLIENITEKEEVLNIDDGEDGKYEEFESDTKELILNNYASNTIRRTRVKNTERSIVSAGEMDMSAINDKINEYLEECSDGRYKCSVCGKMSVITLPRRVQKLNMSKHIETHMEGLTYSCPLCPKICRSRNALAIHKSTYHK